MLNEIVKIIMQAILLGYGIIFGLYMIFGLVCLILNRFHKKEIIPKNNEKVIRKDWIR